MSKETDIQWCDSTVNPTMGCDGCELWNEKKKVCYAGGLHERYGGHNKGFSTKFEILTEYPGRMAKAAAWSDLTGTDRPDKPWLNGFPRHIFVSDMSDALSRDVSFQYLKEEIVDVVSSSKGQRHVWMWLTKQAPRMAQFSDWLSWQGVDWPSNLWPGTSITSQKTIGRVKQIARVGGSDTTRFLSCEPLWSEIKFAPDDLNGIHLVIAGGESGDDAERCDIDWIRKIHIQCIAAKVPLLVKQLGANLQDCAGRYPSDRWPWPQRFTRPYEMERIKLKHSHGGDWNEWPADIRIRQLPTAAARSPR